MHRLRHVVVGAGIEAALAFTGDDLAGHRDDGEVRELVEGADGTDGLVPVHDRHHDVHQHDVDLGHPLQRGDRVGAALGDGDIGVAAFEERRHREDVAEVVVDQQDLHSLDRFERERIEPVGFGPVRR